MARVVTQSKKRYTMHFCGACGKRVRMFDEHCKHCKELIDWGEYLNGENNLSVRDEIKSGFTRSATKRGLHRCSRKCGSMILITLVQGENHR